MKRNKNKVEKQNKEERAVRQSAIGKSTMALSLPFILLCLLIVIFVAVVQYYLAIVQPNEYRIQKFLQASVAGYAETVQIHVNNSKQLMNEWAERPEVIQAISSGNSDQIQNLNQQIAADLPYSMGVHLVNMDLLEVQPDINPPITNVGLEMIRKAQKGTPAAAEAVLPGSSGQYIAVVVPIKDQEQIVGAIFAGLEIKIIEEILSQIKSVPGYIELQQTYSGNTYILGKQGEQSFKIGNPLGFGELENSNWRVAFWPSDPQEFTAGREVIIFWTGILLLLSVIGIGGFFAVRHLQHILKSDAGRFVKLLLDSKDKIRVPADLFDMTLFYEMALTMARSNKPLHQDETTHIEQPLHGMNKKEEAPLQVEEKESLIAPLMEKEDPLELIEEISNNIEMPAEIFRAYDIRGIIDESLTPQIVYEIGRALGSEAYERGEQKVVIARDGRLSGPELLESLKSGLIASGRDVIDIGEVPTPLLYFATHYLDTRSGVIVTGSHNPSNYNGLKMVLAGETLSGDDIQKLKVRIESNDLLSGKGSEEYANVLHDYIGQITNDIALAQPLKVAVDCGNGVTGKVIPQLLQALGCEVIGLYCDVDGNFPNHHPDPSKPKNLEELIELVKSEQADIGFAFDGDGDRLGVIDSSGNIIWPDRQMMLYSMDVLSRHPGADIIYDVKCSRNLSKVISANGGRPIMWKTGHSLIKAKMRETGALLAGECSGHIFFKERWYGFDDALYTCARLLEILASDMRKSVDVFAALPNSLATPELNLSIEEGKKFQFVNKLAKQGLFNGGEINTIDGIRVDYDDGWGLVRASNTTPCLVIRFEADSEQALERIQQEFRNQILALDSSLQLPF